ncbi:MAG TPA: pitrilysin family protein [Terriglobia bacterium]|nr:pitrilysin family protein [Terriglobia bacterium]
MRKAIQTAIALALFGAAIFGSVPGAAQTSGPSAVERKNRVPYSAEVLRVKLPKVTEAVLPNGLTVLVLEDRRLPLISMRYDIAGGGALYDPADMPGLAAAAAQIMREGTRSRTSEQIAEELARLGASVNVSAPYGSTEASLTASGMSTNFAEWFDIANDILLNSCFPPNEVKRYQQRTLVSLRQQRSEPGFLAMERFRSALYGDSPAAIISTNADVVGKLKTQMLNEWRRTRLTPQNTVVGIAGDVRASDVIRKLEKATAAWKRSELTEELPPTPGAAPGGKVLLVDRPGSVQTTIYLGNVALDRRDPDYIPLVVANRVLGGNASARLFLNLREEKGYTYGAYSQLQASKYPGPWRAYADVRTEVTEGAMREFMREIHRMSDERVPATELAEVQRSIVGSFALSLEDKDTLLGYAMTRKLYNLPEDYWDTYPAKVMAVTPADIERVARKYMNPERLQIVAVGDASKVRDIFGRYGAVELYGIDGTRARQ